MLKYSQVAVITEMNEVNYSSLINDWFVKWQMMRETIYI